MRGRTSFRSRPLSTIPATLAAALSDRYRIERELGRGGMATVWLADDLKHRRKVALKVMHPDMAAAIGYDRFLREIEIAARLSHPHILPLFDSGAADGQFYYVMPYVSGESLRARLDRERPLALDEALRLTREIAGALGHAHAQDLVHRDVKPENVLLSDGIALVADFGIARVRARDGDATATTLAATLAATRGATGVGFTLGTPLYMAPEQATGDAALDGRADQYSLGCVLYEMLAGQPPFRAASVSELIACHLRDPVPPLRHTRGAVPESIERVLFKALAKSPGDRYPSMARFAEALAAAASGGRTPTPAPVAHETAVPNNLPRNRTTFVGRERELAECARLVGETRLLTLTGVGGCGKTRLGLKLAESLLEAHPDGVWWVDLAPVSEEARLPLAIAGAIGLQEETGHALLETIGRHLSGKRVVIVLDNCEHLLTATGDAVDALLSACDELRVIVTSREGLGMGGEHVFALRSLAVPGAAEAGDLHAVEASDAVKLFVDRARQAAREFTLGSANAAAVAEICRRLDGMPLAIELAAARVKVLTVEQIRAKLDDRFKLLTGGSKALPRHQTLRATIQWSVDQLEDAERELFRDLAVFAGGWTLPDAVAVAGEAADEFEVLDRLGHLVDKSLVNVDRDGGGEARYSMLETVRQFALELLNASPDRDAVRDRHLERYRVFLRAQEDAFFGRGSMDALAAIDRELENVLAALAWCGQAANGAEIALELLSRLGRYWPDRGLLELGRRLLTEALARPGAEAPTVARARALASLADLGYYRGDYAQAGVHGLEALAIARRTEDSRALLNAFDAAASALLATGEVNEARGLCEEFVDVARANEESVYLTGALTYLGEIRRVEGDYSGALALYEELIPLARQRGEASLVLTLNNLGMIRCALGDADGARDASAESARVARGVRSKRARMSAVDVAAAVAAVRGAWAMCARLYGAGDAAQERVGAQREPADAMLHDPLRQRAEERLGAARFAEVYGAGRAVAVDAALDDALAWFAAGAPAD